MANISEHFTSEEFACRDGCGYGQPHRELIRKLERLRRKVGPLVIVSGIRCPVRNTEVYKGKITRSRHQSCEAVDLRPGVVRKAQAIDAGFTGIGMKGQWVTHVDVRNGPVTVWDY